MVSSKGKPTDPKLREEAKEDVKQMPNKDGGGKGQMAAWKAGKISEEYEKRGGGYENEAGSANEPTKGAPKPKSDEKKAKEVKDSGAGDQKDDKPKANSGKKATGKKTDGKPKAPKKEKKAPAEGTRKSGRLSNKRSAPADEGKPAAKKAKNGK
ncbi:uncharacterized protein KY384_001467 [Bacidia gigantensis]|uniref:uncharacterized protein n=1 Tax=Bacidia gigantensis TaxID=2732470 RepID=UPI001D053B90|nr:uncharacterized protein KY384_001467 [Bacidia gigantensis]KAG8533726.1 hypothetical protein KY384_001467 [Bacidia gigantensis]